MKIILMRHGEAELSAISDASRRLTHYGRQQVATSTGRIVGRIDPQIIVVSPYTRAQQTAEIIVDLLIQDVPVETWADITPSGKCPDVLSKLDGADLKEIMLVTHQPFISTFIRYLTGEEIPMATAVVACINIEVSVRGGGELQWVEDGAIN